MIYSSTSNTWEALGKLVSNAFINAIDPDSTTDGTNKESSNTAPQQQPQ